MFEGLEVLLDVSYRHSVTLKASSVYCQLPRALRASWGPPRAFNATECSCKPLWFPTAPLSVFSGPPKVLKAGFALVCWFRVLRSSVGHTWLCKVMQGHAKVMQGHAKWVVAGCALEVSQLHQNKRETQKTQQIFPGTAFLSRLPLMSTICPAICREILQMLQSDLKCPELACDAWNCQGLNQDALISPALR